jgi:hypothetical protein
MVASTAELERPMLRMGSVAFLAGLVIIIISTLFHASSEDLMDNPVVFAVYAESDTWIAAAPQKPIALFLSAGIVNRLMTIERADGAMRAAPTP